MTGRLRSPLPTVSLDRARQLRTRTTDVENELWFHLRAGRLGGVKFRRQHPFPPYVVDFYCHAARLVIELDGSQHDSTIDLARTDSLRQRGLTVLRFSNFDVLENEGAVLEAIWAIVAPSPLSPTPLPLGEGLQTSSDSQKIESDAP